jgi:hypothetical protein
MNADGSGQTRLTNTPSPDTAPDWSPDGTKIVFSTREDSRWQLYIMNADGTNPTKLTRSVDDERDDYHDPSWSPDGTKIAYSYYTEDLDDDWVDDGYEIYVENANRGGRTLLTDIDETDDFAPDWSPDGTKIAYHSLNFSSIECNNEIYVMNADGTNPTRLACNPASDISPIWSPDGTKIVFQSNRDGNSEIYVMNADGSGQTNISNNPAFEDQPDWGPATSIEPEEDTAAPVITVPDDITEEATSPDGATVSFEVSAQDDVDGPTDADCDHNSGEIFPIGETLVTCNAEDLVGNHAEESFTITVQDTTDPDVEITEASDRRNGREIAEGSTTNMRYIEITFEANDAVGIDNTECSLDGAAFTSCTSPVVYDRLSRDTHQFTVRSTDAAGNTGEDEFTWTVNNPSAAAAPGRQ